MILKNFQFDIHHTLFKHIEPSNYYTANVHKNQPRNRMQLDFCTPATHRTETPFYRLVREYAHVPKKLRYYLWQRLSKASTTWEDLNSEEESLF